MVETSILISAAAGLGSFISPCILPILPAFLSYLSGLSINEIQKESTSINDDYNNRINSNKNNKIRNVNVQYENIGQQQRHQRQLQSPQITIRKSIRLNIFLNTVYFVLGFSLIFAVLGVILNSVLATAGIGFQHLLSSAGGIVIIGFGAYLILSTKLRGLNFEKKLTKLPRFKTSYITSFVFGAAFAAGWTPCVGPILGSIFALAATSPGAAYNSLLAYSLGLGVPFLITGAFFTKATGIIRRIVKHLKYFNPVMGAMLIIVGILIFTNQLSVLGNFPLVNQISDLEGSLSSH
ncbi:MAG TPA: cytochrome c biogenesis protein CcdA [Nitrososphaeraceae archaeon]|jgi:cytochrome c-type biogenesis protein|nr:cytochrome c biogenesis protein CcdA [Nitrososphaeraceae archaeon]